MTDTIAETYDIPLGSTVSVEKMPAHWLMAQLGKRVLRPGGVETTRWLLDSVKIRPDDDVVEFAPGLGLTLRDILAFGPKSYAGVERDPAATLCVERVLESSGFAEGRVVCGDAADTQLADSSASVVVGEAMLSMHPTKRKRAIVDEARRVLRTGGRYAIHELALQPDDLADEEVKVIQKDLSRAIRVGVSIGTVTEWKRWLEEAGFEVETVTTAPMRLLEPRRLIQDEGLGGMLRLMSNALRTPGARKRLLGLRSVFRRHAEHLCAVAIVARRVEVGGEPS